MRFRENERAGRSDQEPDRVFDREEQEGDSCARLTPAFSGDEEDPPRDVFSLTGSSPRADPSALDLVQPVLCSLLASFVGQWKVQRPASPARTCSHLPATNKLLEVMHRVRCRRRPFSFAIHWGAERRG